MAKICADTSVGLHMNFTELKLLRDRLGLSQGYVAEEIGVSQAYLSRLESGVRDNPRPVVAKAIQQFIRNHTKATDAAIGCGSK